MLTKHCRWQRPTSLRWGIGRRDKFVELGRGGNLDSKDRQDYSLPIAIDSSNWVDVRTVQLIFLQIGWNRQSTTRSCFKKNRWWCLAWRINIQNWLACLKSFNNNWYGKQYCRLPPLSWSERLQCLHWLSTDYSRLIEFTKTDQQFGANKSIVCPETGPLVVPPLQYQEYSIFPNLISLSPAVLKSDDPALSPTCRARKMTHW